MAQFMKLEINNRICIILGPTTSGKTTLARRLKKEFKGKSVIISHDDICNSMSIKRRFANGGIEFKKKYFLTIKEAIEDINNDLIIIDSVNIESKNFLSFIMLINTLIPDERLTVIKMNVDIETRKKFSKDRIKKMRHSDKKMIKLYLNAFFEQDKIYKSENGSLNTSMSYIDEFIITNPIDLEIEFKSLENKIDDLFEMLFKDGILAEMFKEIAFEEDTTVEEVIKRINTESLNQNKIF